MNFLFTRGYFISPRVWGLRESSSVYRKSIPGFRLDLHFRKSRGYIFPEYDTLLIIKNLSNMWKCDPKKWVHLFGKTPMVCFLIRFTVGCIKLNLNLYNFVYEESHYTYTAHTLQHVPNYSYIRWVITFKIYLARNASVKLSPVSSANKKMSFYSLQKVGGIWQCAHAIVRTWYGKFSPICAMKGFIKRRLEQNYDLELGLNSLEF